MTQAKALAESLKIEPVSHILCSDLKRASRTAGAIAEHHPDTLVVSHQLLREQDFGELEGKSWRETWTADAATRAHAMARFGESNDALVERAGLAWDWVLEQVPAAEEPQHVVVVSHGLFLSALLTNICLYYDTPRPANVHWGNTGYVRFTLMNDRAPVLVFDRINESGHLASIQRQKGGVGSSKFDEKQKPISQFFSASPQKK
jgi:probable phosphoglycerate mutase